MRAGERRGPRRMAFAHATSALIFISRPRGQILQAIDRPTVPIKPNEPAWKSDVAAQLLRRSGIPFITLNPGASYRGLHDSLVNVLGNAAPQMLLCLNEDHVVSIACV